MANVLLGVTGSVAAILTPDLYQRLKEAGHEVKVVATQPSLYFFDPRALDPVDPAAACRNPEVVVLDEDEWPGIHEGQRWQRGEPVQHIRLRRWGELLLIAPLDANTLGKLANGLCDNCLTCIWRAWEPARPVVLAPAMNTLMWEHPATRRHLRQLADDAGCVMPPELELDEVMRRVNHDCPQLRVVPPVSKRLADGDVGMGGMAALDQIVEVVHALTIAEKA
jgi:phosphopantothenoylcysteine decarboxylase